MTTSPIDLEAHRAMLLGRARSLRFLWDWPPTIDVEDVVSATLLKAWERREQFRGTSGGEAASWLLSILYSQVVDILRKNGALKRGEGRLCSFEEFISHSNAGLERMFASDISTPSAKVANEELIHAVYAAIELLPARQRMALLARFIGQWTIERIALELDKLAAEAKSPSDPIGASSETTPKAVTNLIERALRKLRDLLEHLE